MELTPERERTVLATGTIEVVGRVAWSSNAALLVTVAAGDDELLAVYKPQRGERPLWDFPDGTLCRREVASFVVSDALGWDIVPTTVLRDGPYGIGMVQRFVEHDPDDHYFTLLEHHTEEFLRFAVFDVVVNNADRKGGHCLCEMTTGHIFGIDHGLTFHVGPKLRTVIWDFASEPVPEHLMADVVDLRAALEGALGDELRGLLHPGELQALTRRIDDLLVVGRLPEPDEGYHHVPWPLV
ncbi:MAG: SCO1664 family protein [Acidimicrobiia bacterium]